MTGSEFFTNLGLLATAIGTVFGSWALIQAKRTDRKSATREEVQQAFDLQGEMLDRFQADNAGLRDRVNELIGSVHTLTDLHRQCEMDRLDTERRLHLAEARIAELGG